MELLFCRGTSIKKQNKQTNKQKQPLRFPKDGNCQRACKNSCIQYLSHLLFYAFIVGIVPTLPLFPDYVAIIWFRWD